MCEEHVCEVHHTETIGHHNGLFSPLDHKNLTLSTHLTITQQCSEPLHVTQYVVKYRRHGEPQHSKARN